MSWLCEYDVEDGKKRNAYKIVKDGKPHSRPNERYMARKIIKAPRLECVHELQMCMAFGFGVINFVKYVDNLDFSCTYS